MKIKRETSLLKENLFVLSSFEDSNLMNRYLRLKDKFKIFKCQRHLLYWLDKFLMKIIINICLLAGFLGFRIIIRSRDHLAAAAVCFS